MTHELVFSGTNIDPELIRRLNLLGTLTIDGKEAFCLQIPNKSTGFVAEFRFSDNKVVISQIKDGQRKEYVKMENVTLGNIGLNPAGDLTVRKPEWHSFDVFGITPGGSLLINTRE